MKKILLILGITSIVFSSCSKEEGPDDPYNFFFFDIKYGSKQVVEYGHNEYNDYYSRTIYEGPKYISSAPYDEAILYVWPDYSGPLFYLWTLWETEPIIFSKKGTDILGEYTIRDTVTTHFKVAPRFSSSTFFHVVPGTEKLTIMKTGESNEGKFVEGTMNFMARVESDTIPVPVTATFRLKKH
ncbi:MAG TPA: hypothetical protein VFX73_12160 [Chitinophagaceae bacterium]|nr:hypothetical protein [Chitinophagaceae bacterium]